MIIVIVLLASSARSNKKVKKMQERYYNRQKSNEAIAQIEQWTASLKAYNARKKGGK